MEQLLRDDPRADRAQLSHQQRLVETALGTCWVAVREDGSPCFMQWMMPANFNDAIRAQFGPTYQPLEANEVLVEGAFTPVAHRRLGIATRAMALVAASAPEPTRWVWTYVGVDNVPTLKGCTRAGFEPTLRGRTQWRFFRQTTRFEVLSNEVIV